MYHNLLTIYVLLQHIFCRKSTVYTTKKTCIFQFYIQKLNGQQNQKDLKKCHAIHCYLFTTLICALSSTEYYIF